MSPLRRNSTIGPGHIFLNPEFERAVHLSGVPYRRLAVAASIAHPAYVWLLVAQRRVPNTAINRRRLCAIADAVGYPRENLFVEEPACASEAVPA